jgi:DNA modification methylase
MIRVLEGDCRDVLRTLDAGSVQCCVTSPPYFNLRDYGIAGQIGAEASPDEYVAAMVGVFGAVRRVLSDDGTVFLNLGDSYVSNGRYDAAYEAKKKRGGIHADDAEKYAAYDPRPAARAMGIKPKDLLGIPWRVAFALQADGWWLRSAIVWAKPNPMPESCRDRPTSSYEMVFLLAKSERYYWDADAIKEDGIVPAGTKGAKGSVERFNAPGVNSRPPEYKIYDGTRNARNVWTIATQPYSGAHFATMPPELAERCIKAGSRPGDTVLDPFLGAGTTGLVADRLGRHCIGIDLNPAYGTLAAQRITGDCPMFASVSTR